jgi:hypothetical protein
MKAKVSRGQICSLLGLTSTNLDNRVRNSQLALAFGLQAPADRGEYHPLDVFVNKLADALVERGFARETATELLRDYHEVWLSALTRAEWEPSMVRYNCRHEIVGGRAIYLAIAREVDAKRGRESFYVVQGLRDEAMAALDEKPAADMVFVRIADVLNDTLDAFEEAGLLNWLMDGKPDVFTRPRSHPEFPEWRAEIERVRQQSVDRLKTRDRVKRERDRAVRQAIAKLQQQPA